MKILLLASYADSLIRFRGDLIKELIYQGNDVVACAPNISDTVSSQLIDLGAEPVSVELLRTGLNPIADIKYVFSIRRVIKEIQPDVMLSYTVKPNVWGSFACRIGGVRSIAMVTGLGFAFAGRGSVKQKIVGLFVKCLYRLSTSFNRMVIFQNRDDAGDFISSGCIADEAKIRYINGSGVNISHYTTTALPDEPVFLLVARLLYSKGIMEYADAANIVLKQLPNAKFYLAGFYDEGHDGLTESDVERIRSLGVEYIGELEDVRPALTNSSIYVLPSYREGTPRSVLEAMAMGRPIITTDAPGCRETTVDGLNGYLVPVRNTEVLAEKMLFLASDHNIRERFGAESRRIAVSKYSVSEVNKTLLGYIAESIK